MYITHSESKMTSGASSIDPVKADKRGTNIQLNQLDRGMDKDMKDTTPLMSQPPANKSESEVMIYSSVMM